MSGEPSFSEPQPDQPDAWVAFILAYLMDIERRYDERIASASAPHAATEATPPAMPAVQAAHG